MTSLTNRPAVRASRGRSQRQKFEIVVSALLRAQWRGRGGPRSRASSAPELGLETRERKLVRSNPRAPTLSCNPLPARNTVPGPAGGAHLLRAHPALMPTRSPPGSFNPSDRRPPPLRAFEFDRHGQTAPTLYRAEDQTVLSRTVVRGCAARRTPKSEVRLVEIVEVPPVEQGNHAPDPAVRRPEASLGSCKSRSVSDIGPGRRPPPRYRRGTFDRPD